VPFSPRLSQKSSTLYPVLIRYLALAALIFFSSSIAQIREAQPLTLRILLAQQNKVTVTFPGNHSAVYQDGTVLNTSPTPLEWRLSVVGGKIGIDANDGVYNTGRDRLILQTSQGVVARDGYFQFGDRVYRGAAVALARDGQVTLVNAVDVEEYVRGVLPMEMPTSWQDEALKSQAVIARTYAIANLKPNSDYDLCATERCQVYGGANVETPRGDAAAAATRGQILSWQGRPARTYFHAESGGYTASSREIWGNVHPYLQARPDPGGVASQTPWRITVSTATLQQAVSKYLRVGTIQTIRVVNRTESNRPTAIEINGSSGKGTITGTNIYAFARAIGAKSSMIDFVTGNVVEGYGNGHGVGLSQYGARFFAAQGYAYTQILGYYYPGVAIGPYEVVP
jgi:stage II sporulation protein D